MTDSGRMVALLRGINVGGNRKVPMPGLRQVFAEVGCDEVETYIQSGNVVFLPGRAGEPLQAAIEQRIEAAFGFRVLVVLRTAAELAAVVRENPFPAARGDTDLHVSFLAEVPPAGYTDAMEAAAFAPSAFALRGRDLYLYLPEGLGRSKLAETVAKLPGTATVRNWRTVTRLAEMVGR